MPKTKVYVTFAANFKKLLASDTTPDNLQRTRRLFKECEKLTKEELADQGYTDRYFAKCFLALRKTLIFRVPLSVAESCSIQELREQRDRNNKR